MTTLKVNNYQLGQSGTAANNFILEASATGVSVSTGTVGSPLTENFNINSNGSLELKNAANQKVNSVTAATNVTLDCSTGNIFSYDLTQDTTFYSSNVPAGGTYQFTLLLNYTTFYNTNFLFGTDVWYPNSQFTIWPGVNRLTFLTDDGGTNWYATGAPL